MFLPQANLMGLIRNQKCITHEGAKFLEEKQIMAGENMVYILLK